MTSDAFNLRSSELSSDLDAGGVPSGANESFFISLDEPVSSATVQPSHQTPAKQISAEMKNAEKKKRGAQQKAKNSKRRGAVLIEVEEEEEEELTWYHKIIRALVGMLGVGLFTSLLFHFFSGLAIFVFGYLFINAVNGNSGVEMNASITEGKDSTFEELDSSINLAGGSEDLQDSVDESQLLVLESDTKMETKPMFATTKIGSGNDSSGDGGKGGSGFRFQMPGGGRAVTKGSFTVWTDPKDPAPGENYNVIIQIKLPARKRIKHYYLRDLSGKVEGSDNYSQNIPPGDPKRNEKSRKRLKVIKNMVQYSVTVPGASRLVKDTVKIRSKMLKEEQTLEIVF